VYYQIFYITVVSIQNSAVLCLELLQ